MYKQIVTRFAPSPTGFMHVGGIRTALYAWAFARKFGGSFILRIEDTDKKREVDGSIDHIIESLQWLGIDWDEGVDIGGKNAPYKQSERLDSYKKYAQILIERGLAYPDPYTEEEIESFRKKATEEKKAFLFRDHRPATFEKWDGTKPLRFKVPDIKKYTWQDVVRGELHAGEEALDDFILIKSDGYPTYNFAHIIDDFEMGVTHIMRADEFIASTPKFLSLYEALDITPPIFVTLPPILGQEGNKKLGKRDGAKDILVYREEGYLPEAMINFLAYLGWNPGDEREVMSKEEFVQSFTLEKIHKSGAMLNEEKLLWFNKEHIRRQTQEDQLKHVAPFFKDYDKYILKRLLPYIVDRISIYGELRTVEESDFRFFRERPSVTVDKILWKDSSKEEVSTHLKEVADLILYCDYSSPEVIKAAILPYAEQHGKGNVLWPLRMALSGQEKSIDPFTICYVLGYDEAKTRIRIAVDMLDS